MSPVKSYCIICFSIELQKGNLKNQILFVPFALFIIIIFITFDLSFFRISLLDSTYITIVLTFIAIGSLAFYIGYENETEINIAREESKLLKFKAYSNKYTFAQPGFNFEKNSVVKKTIQNEDEIREKLNDTNITCYECGEQITKELDYCSHCGYETKDELLEKYKIFEPV